MKLEKTIAKVFLGLKTHVLAILFVHDQILGSLPVSVPHPYYCE